MLSKYEYLTTNGELSHHGILGQKWGKRNGPPYPLKPSDHSASEKKAGYKKSLDKGEDNTDSTRKGSKTSKPLKGKRELTPEQIAYRNKMKKLALATAGVVGVSAAGYMAYKSGLIKNLGDFADQNGGLVDKDVLQKALQAAKDDVDFVLPKGTTIRRTTPQKDWDVDDARDALYTTFDKKDAAIYRQLLRLRDENGKDLPRGSKVYEVSMELQKDYKIATKSTLENIFEKLKQDPEFATDMYNQTRLFKIRDYTVEEVKNDPVLFERVQKAVGLDDAIYQLVKDGKATDTFRNTIKSQGFDGIIDYHDVGGVSEAPVIMFDKTGIVKTGEKEVKRALDGKIGLGVLKDAKLISETTAEVAVAGKVMVGQQIIKMGAVPVGAGVVASKVNKHKKNKQNAETESEPKESKEDEKDKE